MCYINFKIETPHSTDEELHYLFVLEDPYEGWSGKDKNLLVSVNRKGEFVPWPGDAKFNYELDNNPEICGPEFSGNGIFDKTIANQKVTVPNGGSANMCQGHTSRIMAVDEGSTIEIYVDLGFSRYDATPPGTFRFAGIKSGRCTLGNI